VDRTDQLAGDGQPIAFNAALDKHTLPDVLEIGNFVTVTIEDGERQQTLRTAAQTVGAVLQEAGSQFTPRTASSRRSVPGWRRDWRFRCAAPCR
jgi:hypothetical protein